MKIPDVLFAHLFSRLIRYSRRDSCKYARKGLGFGMKKFIFPQALTIKASCTNSHRFGAWWSRWRVGRCNRSRGELVVCGPLNVISLFLCERCPRCVEWYPCPHLSSPSSTLPSHTQQQGYMWYRDQQQTPAPFTPSEQEQWNKAIKEKTTPPKQE